MYWLVCVEYGGNLREEENEDFDVEIYDIW